MNAQKTTPVAETRAPSEISKAAVAILNNLAALLKVKSLLTVVMTAVFSVLALNGTIEPKDVLTVFLMIVSFYFGTQSTKSR